MGGKYKPVQRKKTLITCGPGVAAVLIETLGERRRMTPKKFKDAHEALDWCQANGAGMVYIAESKNMAEMLALAV